MPASSVWRTRSPAFAATPMGRGCELLDGAQALRRAPMLHPATCAALVSPHELRVESREALPRLAAWLEQAHGVRFFWGETVHGVDAPRVHTSRRALHAEHVARCPGSALTGVAADLLQPYGLRLTRLQMLRLRAEGGWRLPGAVMGDLSLVRYAGFAALAEAAALRAELEAQAPQCLAHGVHVIAVLSADGTLVVGDSHHDDAVGPFGPVPSEAVDVLVVKAGDVVRVVVVTSGTGASTGFAIGEEVCAGW